MWNAMCDRIRCAAQTIAITLGISVNKVLHCIWRLFCQFYSFESCFALSFDSTKRPKFKAMTTRRDRETLTDISDNNNRIAKVVENVFRK